MPLVQRRKRTDLCDMFNKILYIISIKGIKNSNKFVPLFDSILPFHARRTKQVSLTVINNKIALLTTPTISKLFVDCKM